MEIPIEISDKTKAEKEIMDGFNKFFVPPTEMVSISLLQTQPNPIRFPEGNTFFAVLPPDFKQARVGVDPMKQYVLVGVVSDSLVFAEWPNPICEAFRLAVARAEIVEDKKDDSSGSN